MNNFSTYTFRLYHYLLNLRDTLEYAIKRDHKIELYEARKKILTENLEEGTAFGDFLKNNGEVGDKIKEKLVEFIDNLYSENSTILMPSNDIVRVDYAQIVTLFDMCVGLTETLRDVVYQHISYGQQNKEIDQMIVLLVSDDEKMYRSVLAMLVMNAYFESFKEFQKVMQESNGKPTPQSNFILQNELAKFVGFLRFSRQHARCTDNETLDLLDDTFKVIEMAEGRRQLPQNTNMNTAFTDILKRLNDAVASYESAWRNTYQNVVKEITKNQQPADPAN